MTGKRVSLKRPASAIYIEAGNSACIHLAKDTIVEILCVHEDGNRLADVQVDGKKLLMFTQDLSESSESSSERNYKTGS